MVTNLYPYPEYPAYGNAIKAQIDSLSGEGIESDVLFINGRKSIWNYLKAPFELWRKLPRKRYDLMHAHFGLAGLVARLEWRLPLVVSLIGDDVLGQPDRHGQNTPLGQFFQETSRWLARHADAVIVMSEEMRRLVGNPEAIVLGNGVDTEVFRPMDRTAACARLGLDPSMKYVLFPYNPRVPRKRFDLVEQAVARARRRVPQLEILVAFRSSHEELAVTMNAADVFVLASYWEGSPNTIKEAMSTNLPTISAPIGDVPELFDQVAGCFLCNPEPDALADRIVEVCSQPRLSRGRNRIAPLAMERVALRLANLYRRLLGKPEREESALHLPNDGER